MIKEINNKIYSANNISAKSIITELHGVLKDHYTSDNDLQIGYNCYLTPTGGFLDKIQHSCNPNSYIYIVGKRAFLYSIFDIKANTEITFDYSLTSSEGLDTFNMVCNCGFYCRKTISGYKELSEEVKKKYLDLKIVPLFLIDDRFKK